jgi:hypothetical protein
VVVTNLGGSQGNLFDIDRVVANSTTDPTSLPGSTAPPPRTAVPIAAIVGGIAGALLVLAAIAGIAWCAWRKRRQQERQRNAPLIDLTGDEVKPFRHSGQIGAEVPFIGYALSAYDLPPSTSSLNDLSDRPFLSVPPPTSNTLSYPRSAEEGSVPGGTDRESERRHVVPFDRASHSDLSGPSDSCTLFSPSSLLAPAIDPPSTAPTSRSEMDFVAAPEAAHDHPQPPSRPTFPVDRKSTSAASMVHTLRTRPAGEEQSVRTSRRADEEEALFRSGSARRAEEETETMPPPYM